MKWHEHPMAWKQFAILSGISGKCEEVVPKLRQVMLSARAKNGPAFINAAAQLHGEMLWTQNDRPYYDLYPSVAEAFTKVDLEKLRCDDVHLPIPQLLIRLPVGREIEGPRGVKIRTILVAETETVRGGVGPNAANGGRGWLVAVNDGTMSGKLPFHIVTGIRFDPNTTIMDHLRWGDAAKINGETFDQQGIIDSVKIIVTLCLLKNNPDLIEPIPLEADRAKWEQTHDLKLIQKAAGRGKRGWAIGRHIEVAPGFRRPHFAIRWCGPGGADPQLKPIKGCLVRRQKISEVPTDWLGPELESVAP